MLTLISGFFGGTPSPLVVEFEDIVTKAWNEVQTASPTAIHGDVSGSKLTTDENVSSNDNNNLSPYNPKSSAFPLVLALTVSNAVFLIGILAGSVLYFRKTKSMQYVAAGAKHAPQ